MAKKENNIPAIIDTPEALEAKIAAMKEAQKIFATYTQEQVDKIFKAAATAAGPDIRHTKRSPYTPDGHIPLRYMVSDALPFLDIHSSYIHNPSGSDAHHHIIAALDTPYSKEVFHPCSYTPTKFICFIICRKEKSGTAITVPL